MAFDLVRDLKGLNGAIRDSLAAVGGANSPEMKATGNALAKQMRKTLSVSGGARIAQSIRTRKLQAIGGTPSRSGEPPRAQTKQLARSVKAGVVGTGIRVGALRFTSGFLEEGVNATRGTRKTRRSGRGRGQFSGRVQRTIRIPARPFLAKSVELAKDAMAKAFGDLAGLSIVPSTK
jgi:hypothetical protein